MFQASSLWQIPNVSRESRQRASQSLILSYPSIQITTMSRMMSQRMFHDHTQPPKLAGRIFLVCQHFVKRIPGEPMQSPRIPKKSPINHQNAKATQIAAERRSISTDFSGEKNIQQRLAANISDYQINLNGISQESFLILLWNPSGEIQRDSSRIPTQQTAALNHSHLTLTQSERESSECIENIFYHSR